MNRSLFFALTLAIVGCKGDGSTDDVDPSCGDVDDDGGDTGDVPSLIGDWTGNVGAVVVDNTCPSDKVPTEVLDFLEQPFLVDGSVPRAVRLTFADQPDLRLRGAVADQGAWAMSGAIETSEATLYTAIGGMLYYDATDRVRWDGAVYIGADLNGDTVIDCDIRMDWKARKSGS